jgi:hypothetical protein
MNQNPAHPRRRSRIAHFKAPFVISVAAPAVFGIGCGGKTDPISEQSALAHQAPVPGTPCDPALPQPDSSDYCPAAACIDGLWERPTCNPPAPPEPTCPEPPPTAPDDACTGAPSCQDGEWVFPIAACNPPPPSVYCPDEPPTAGDACDPYGLTCEYDYCGGLVPMFTCNNDTATWEALHLTSCNPPPPECFFDGSCGESADAGAPPTSTDAGAPDAGG